MIQDNALVMNKSYFDESYFRMSVDGSEILLCNRKISTYVNALAKAGFAIEQMVEQTDEATMRAEGNISDKAKKQKCCPFPFCLRQESYEREKIAIDKYPASGLLFTECFLRAMVLRLTTKMKCYEYKS